MERVEKIRQSAAAALDYALQARCGLKMLGLSRIARDLDPVIENLRQVLKDSLRPSDCVVFPHDFESRAECEGSLLLAGARWVR